MIWTKQFVSYVIVGLTSNGLGFLLFAALTWLGLRPESAVSIMYPVCVGISFVFNKSWSFNHTGPASASAVKYLISYGACYVVNVSALKFFSGYLGYSHLIVQAIAIVVIALVLFLTQKHWVFKTQGDPVPYVQSL